MFNTNGNPSNRLVSQIINRPFSGDVQEIHISEKDFADNFGNWSEEEIEIFEYQYKIKIVIDKRK